MQKLHIDLLINIYNYLTIIKKYEIKFYNKYFNQIYLIIYNYTNNDEKYYFDKLLYSQNIHFIIRNEYYFKKKRIFVLIMQ